MNNCSYNELLLSLKHFVKTIGYDIDRGCAIKENNVLMYAKTNGLNGKYAYKIGKHIIDLSCQYEECCCKNHDSCSVVFNINVNIFPLIGFVYVSFNTRYTLP